MPEAIYKELKKASSQSKEKKHGQGTSVEELLEMVKTNPKGSRNDSLNSVAFTFGNKFVPKHITEQDAKDKLLNAAMQSGLEFSEAKSTIDSGLAAGIREQTAKSKLPDKPSDIQLSIQVIDKYPDICFSDRGWMTYQKGIWSEVKQNIIHGYILNTVCSNYGDSFKLTKTTLSSIRAMMEANSKTYVSTDKFDSNHEKLVLKNGVLNINTNEYGEHYKDLYATISLQYNYDPAATAPHWKSFLTDIFGDSADTINFLPEYRFSNFKPNNHKE